MVQTECHHAIISTLLYTLNDTSSTSHHFNILSCFHSAHGSRSCYQSVNLKFARTQLLYKPLVKGISIYPIFVWSQFIHMRRA